MQALKVIAGTIGFVAIFGSIDWFATVAAPVLGPIFAVALVVAPIWALVKLGKVAR